jgi:adenine-specific DNA-methyltransferase
MDNNFKKSRGQFFTTRDRVLDTLVHLISNNGNILEPSAGQGHIINHIEQKLKREVIGVELDETKVNDKVCNSNIIIDNFFRFLNDTSKFDTIIGNPPFVKLKNVESNTLNILPEKIPANGNLYYFFIKYCASLLNDDGELIFIVPKEWLYNVSSQFIRDFLSENGSFTDFIDCGEEKLFDDADVPALCIFRYQKGYKGDMKYYETLDKFYKKNFLMKKVTFSNTITFSNKNYYGKKVSDYFDVKVGLVTGAEKVFRIEDQTFFNDSFVIEMVGTDKKKTKYLFLDGISDFDTLPKNIKNYLLLNKKKLINRKIKKFDDSNWWYYGALRNLSTMCSNKKRIYGLMKTRNDEIFWEGNEFEHFNGGVVGLFLKDNVTVDVKTLIKHLNSKEFKEIMEENNMYSNNKVSITPSVLSNLPFPFLM